jgi:hypothetical protein
VTPPRIRPDGDGVRLELEPFEVELLRSLPGGVRALLSDPDPDDPAVEPLTEQVVEDEASHLAVGVVVAGDGGG